MEKLVSDESISSASSYTPTSCHRPLHQDLKNFLLPSVIPNSRINLKLAKWNKLPGSSTSIVNHHQDYAVQRAKFVKASQQANLSDGHGAGSSTAGVASRLETIHPKNSSLIKLALRSIDIEKEKLRHLYAVASNCWLTEVDSGKNHFGGCPQHRRQSDKLEHAEAASQTTEDSKQYVCSEANGLYQLREEERPSRIEEITNPADTEICETKPTDTAAASAPTNNESKIPSNGEKRETACMLKQGQVIFSSNELLESDRLAGTPPLPARRHHLTRSYPARRSCAHCRRLIADIAFFNGSQQLCSDCADSHFEMVTIARLQERPMAYNEFRNVGGDTFYSTR